MDNYVSSPRIDYVNGKFNLLGLSSSQMHIIVELITALPNEHVLKTLLEDIVDDIVRMKWVSSEESQQKLPF